MAISSKELTNRLIAAYDEGDRGRSKLKDDPRILELYAINSVPAKHFFNNLCFFKGTNYLELGTYRGGTLISALFKNNLVSAYGVDNFNYNPMDTYKPELDKDGKPIQQVFPLFPNVRSSLFENLAKYEVEKDCVIIEGDFETFDISKITNKINIINLDGQPGKYDPIKTLQHIDAVLDKAFILVLSYYNLTEMQEVVKYLETTYKLVHKHHKFSASMADNGGWWAGVGFFVLEKK